MSFRDTTYLNEACYDQNPQKREQTALVNTKNNLKINFHASGLSHLAPQVLKSYLLCIVYRVRATKTAAVMNRALRTRSTS